MTMSDPYRTAPIVETPEQRVARLRDTYWNIAMSGIPRDPEARAFAMKVLDDARDRWLSAADALRPTPKYNVVMTDEQRAAFKRAIDALTQHAGAMTGSP